MRKAACWTTPARAIHWFVLGLGALCALSGCPLVVDLEEFSAAPEAPPPLSHPCDALATNRKTTGKGPFMLLVRYPSAGCSWMDETEVTVEQYRAWLTSGSFSTVARVECQWKTEATSPTQNLAEACGGTLVDKESAPFFDEKPIRCVDWCDAVLFCDWAGKRLCYGGMGVNDQIPVGAPAEWRFACSARDERTNSSLPGKDEMACNIDQNTLGCPAGSGSATACGPSQGGVFGDCRAAPDLPFDLSGNVREWIDLCSPGSGPEPPCYQYGGSYLDPPEQTACLSRRVVPRKTRDAQTGFRCCASLTADEESRVPGLREASASLHVESVFHRDGK